ncbi:nucleic acid-binding domain protein [Clostridium sp. CAG:1013]|nr:nucleic acid-binding domain protein [Clostridium sp. CAG:1013]
MRKFVCTLLALCLAASMAACAGSTTTESSAASDSSVASESSVSESSTVSETASEEDTASEESDEASGEVLSYDEYMAAELDSEVTIQAYVQAKQSYYAEQGTATVYLQDKDGGYFAYDMKCSQEDYDAMTEGTCIQVTGFKSEWSGEIEIMDGQLDSIVEGDTFVAEPLDVTEMLGTDELESHQNEKVAFKGLTVEASTDANGNEAAFLYNYDGSGADGDDLYFNVSYNGQTYTFTVESYLCDNTTEVYKAVTALEVGQTIDCEGFLYWYEGVNPHITSVTVAQ